MRIFFSLVKVTFVVFSLSFVLQSCILDEFKVDEIDMINMEEDWGMDIVSPLFAGNFEFKDLIFDDDSFKIQPNDKISILKFPNGDALSIPSRIVFEPTTIIDSLEFLVEGNYSLVSIRLEYQVSNGCPFPFNLKMRLFKDEDQTKSLDPILPPPFQSADISNRNFIPVISRDTITLNSEQSKNFIQSNRIEISTWFDPSDLINQQDTFLSNYPVEISMLLFGEVKRKNAEN